MNDENTCCARLQTKRHMIVRVVYVEPSENERMAAKHAWALLLAEPKRSSFGNGLAQAEKKLA